MIKLLYRVYQIFVLLPIGLLSTAFFGLLAAVMCPLGKGDWWGNFCGKWWGRSLVWLTLLPVKVEGRDNLKPGQSYVLVANHQGCYDIFLVFGFIGVPIRWMMKRSLERIPFIGIACRHAGEIFVDKGGPKAIKATYERARHALQDGVSLMVFPEGARSQTGHMGLFRRSAFMLADELQLPVVPMTINGSFDVMPRHRDMHFALWHPLTLTIHKPIAPNSQGADNVKQTMDESYRVIMNGLDERYQGYVENTDQ